MSRSYRQLMLSSALGLVMANAAMAIVIRHDVPASQYFNLASQYPAAGRIDLFGSAHCSATLVAPDKALTAAHCVDGISGPIDNVADINVNQTRFKLGNNVGNPTHNVGISSIVTNTWNDQARWDMAILNLSSPINNVTPSLLGGENALGKTGTLVGFGYHGTGQNFNYGNDNLKRAAQNVIDIANNEVQTDFDSPNGTTSTLGSSTPLPLEGTTAPGDSGGPIYADFGYGEVIVGVLNGGYNPVGFDMEYGDRSIWAPIDVTRNRNFLENNGLTIFTGGTPTGDFNSDGALNCADVDLLTSAAASGSSDLSFDLDGNGQINRADVQQWLVVAGAQNLPSGGAYLEGDANLDGTVDGNDFITWNSNKFSTAAAFCSGDFNADGAIDGSDFILWNNNKFQTSDSGYVSNPLVQHRPFPGVGAVPEPAISLLSVMGALIFLRRLG